MSTQVTEDAPVDVAPAPAAAREAFATWPAPEPLWAPLLRLARRLSPVERGALGWWLLTRLVVVTLASQAAYLFGSLWEVKTAGQQWYVWDAQHFIKIARFGYDGPPGDNTPFEAFFPGFPGLLRLVHAAVPSWVVAGMLISFVAGAVAIAALVRLTAIDFGADAGGKAALMLMASPLTVFLTAGYTEALFLGFALPAWLCARRRRWAHAAILAAGASCVRISGLFLAVALVVEFAAQWLPGRGLRLRPGRRELLAAPWLTLPLLPIVGYFAYLRERTGSWTYWFEAQRIGWHRENTGFRATFDETIDRAYRGGTANVNMAWSFRMELVAVAVGVVLIVVLLARLRYAEATYVGLSLCALATSTVYFSVARAALLWWPLWAGLGALAAHPRFGRYVTRGYLAFAAPFAAIFVAAFTANRWVG